MKGWIWFLGLSGAGVGIWLWRKSAAKKAADALAALAAAAAATSELPGGAPSSSNAPSAVSSGADVPAVIDSTMPDVTGGDALAVAQAANTVPSAAEEIAWMGERISLAETTAPSASAFNWTNASFDRLKHDQSLFQQANDAPMSAIDGLGRIQRARRR
jgi:predicted secreted protein